MAEVEQQHRHDMDARIAGANIDEMKAERRYAFAGLYSGLAFAVLVIIAGVACAVIGAKEIGIGFVSVGFIGVVAQFVNGRKRNLGVPSPPAQRDASDEPNQIRRRAAVKGTRQTQRRRTKN